MAVPTTERGHAGLRDTGFGLAYYHASIEEITDLTWPTAVRIYDRMRRGDSKVGSSLRSMFLPILSADWRINPRKARPEVVEQVAYDFNLPIVDGEQDPPGRTRDRFDWLFHLRHALLSRVYGFMPMYPVYRWDDATETWRIRKITPRMPHTLTSRGLRIDPIDGGLQGIEQAPAVRRPGDRTFTAGGTGPIFIPIDELVVYCHEREGANWYGQSILRPVYRDWLLKDAYHRIAAVGVDRHGAGVPIYTDAPPENVTDPDAEARAGQALAEGYRAGENAGGRIPHGASFELKGVEGELPKILDYIRYHDEQIAANTLEMFSSLPSAPNGSRALGETLVNFFTTALNSHAGDIARVSTNHLVEDYVDNNWGPDENAPAIECAPIGADQQLTALAIKQLIDAKAITPDPALERYLRRFYKMPELELDDDEDLGPEELQARVEAATALFRAGWLPDAALEAVGLDPIEHSGLLPVTLQADDEPAADVDEPAPAAASASANPTPQVGRYQGLLEQLTT